MKKQIYLPSWSDYIYAVITLLTDFLLISNAHISLWVSVYVYTCVCM